MSSFIVVAFSFIYQKYTIKYKKLSLTRKLDIIKHIYNVIVNI